MSCYAVSWLLGSAVVGSVTGDMRTRRENLSKPIQ